MAVLKATFNLRSISGWLSDDSLTRKAYLNALASVLEYGASLMIGFLVNPMLVAGLGNYLYGTWQILGRFAGYISAASGRPTQALKWTIANRQASTDYEEKRRQIGSAAIVWLLFLPLLSVSGAVLAWFSPIWLTTPIAQSASVRLATAVLVANVIMISLADIPQSVLQGQNLGYKRMGLSTILVMAGGGLIALALYFNTGLVGVAVANLASSVLTGAFFLKIVRSYAPWFGLARPLIGELRAFLGLSWWFLAWRLVNQLIMASDVIVLGMANSVESVTTYTLTKYVPENVISVVAIVVFGITPGLGGIIGSGDLKKAARIRGEIMAGTWFLATTAGTTIVLWNGSFVPLWVGKQHYAGGIPTLLIMFMVAQFVLIRNDANIIDLTLRLSRKVLMGASSAVMSLIIAVVFVGLFHSGTVGLCAGFIAGRSALSVYYPWLVGRSLDIPFRSQLMSVLRPGLVTIVLFALALAGGNYLIVNTWLELILYVGGTMVLVAVAAFYAGLGTEDRRRLLGRVRMAINRGTT